MSTRSPDKRRLAAAVSVWALAGYVGLWGCLDRPQALAASPDSSKARVFNVSGLVSELPKDGRTVVVSHEAIPGYMDAMTMPFKVREPDVIRGLEAGDKISFQLHVTETESWIDGITNRVKSVIRAPKAEAARTRAPAVSTARHPLLDFSFTNELSQPVTLGQFRGEALAITFFFTRCPIPDYCPRLSKNFEEASQKLSHMANAPTNWHFLSVTFDPEFDTPAVLKAYGERYGYDPRHWSFVTGPADKIHELARLSDVTFTAEGGSITHNFRTLIIDPAGHLQMVFPTSGNLSAAIVEEILKATAATPPAT